MKRFFYAWLLVLVALPVAAADKVDSAPGPDTSEEAIALLHSVGAAYEKIETFHFEATESSISSINGWEKRTDSRTLTAMDAEGRFRVESDHPVDGGQAVFDGDATWAYLARRNQYARIEGELRADRIRSKRGPPNLGALKDRFVSRYRDLGQRVVAAKIEGQEPITTADGDILCTVVWAAYEAPRGIASRTIEKKLWIDPEQNLILRDGYTLTVEDTNRGLTMEAAKNVSFLIARVNQTFPDELFTFSPPEGSVEVEVIEPDEMVGRVASAFELEDLHGRVHRLSEMRGKVVLLDFWATWCGPCRLDLPRIEALHQQFADQGLVALGVNDEDEEAARAYAEGQGYSFPTLTDTAKLLTREFGVRVLPTVVVLDREGRVASYLVGAHSEDDLRAAVKQAGLE